MYAAEGGGQWAVSLHFRGAMRLETGAGRIEDGVSRMLRELKGRQHVEVMPTRKLGHVQDAGHVLKEGWVSGQSPDLERLLVALGLSQGGVAQKAGAWIPPEPEGYKGRFKKKK